MGAVKLYAKNNAYKAQEEELAAHGRQYDGKLVIFGHTETEEVTYRSPDSTKLQLLSGETYELPKQGCINMDTGCVYGQKLSALVIENGTIRVYQQNRKSQK